MRKVEKEAWTGVWAREWEASKFQHLKVKIWTMGIVGKGGSGSSRDGNQTGDVAESLNGTCRRHLRKSGAEVTHVIIDIPPAWHNTEASIQTYFHTFVLAFIILPGPSPIIWILANPDSPHVVFPGEGRYFNMDF